MPVVWIPSLMRKLTGNQEQIEVTGVSLREVIVNQRAVPGDPRPLG